jgi:putative addiction module killer protein
MAVIELRYYPTGDGRSPFEEGFSCLDSAAAAKVSVALVRLEAGNLSNVKAVGEDVAEYRIDWGPGYRVYFGRDGAALVILSDLRHQKAAALRRGGGGLQATTAACAMSGDGKWH